MSGPTNITIDDTDPTIQYNGSSWTAQPGCTTCFVELDTTKLVNGTWHAVGRENNLATFTFKGIAIYVQGARPKQRVYDWLVSNITVSLDGNQTVFYEAPPLSGDNDYDYNFTLFKAEALENTPHTLTLQVSNSSILLLDSITYTTAPETSAKPSDTLSLSSPGMNAVVVGGVVGGIFGFIILGAIAIYFLVRRQLQPGVARRYSTAAPSAPWYESQKEEPYASTRGNELPYQQDVDLVELNSGGAKEPQTVEEPFKDGLIPHPYKDTYVRGNANAGPSYAPLPVGDSSRKTDHYSD